MKSWMEEFIRQCLEGVPEGNYRTRTEKELRDHLECQRRALLEAGRTEAEARAETLGLMGDPEKLKEEYLAAWRRSLPGRLAALIIPVLCVHWAYIVAYMGMWQAIDDHHMPFWEAFGEFLARSAWYHLFTLQLCILLGVLFAQKRERSRELA